MESAEGPHISLWLILPLRKKWKLKQIFVFFPWKSLSSLLYSVTIRKLTILQQELSPGCHGDGQVVKRKDNLCEFDIFYVVVEEAENGNFKGGIGREERYSEEGGGGK